MITNAMRRVAWLANDAEKNGEKGLYEALCNVLGRMHRNVGGDWFDSDEFRDAAISRGMTRARTICTVAPSATPVVDLFTPDPASLHLAGEC